MLWIFSFELVNILIGLGTFLCTHLYLTGDISMLSESSRALSRTLGSGRWRQMKVMSSWGGILLEEWQGWDEWWSYGGLMPGLSLPGRLTGFSPRPLAWDHSQLGSCSTSLTGMTTYVWRFSNAWHRACQARARMTYFGRLLPEPFIELSWPLWEPGALAWSPGSAPLDLGGLNQVRVLVSCRNHKWATPVGISRLTGALLLTAGFHLMCHLPSMGLGVWATVLLASSALLSLAVFCRHSWGSHWFFWPDAFSFSCVGSWARPRSCSLPFCSVSYKKASNFLIHQWSYLLPPIVWSELNFSFSFSFKNVPVCFNGNLVGMLNDWA